MEISPAELYAWNMLVVPLLLLFIRWARPKLRWVAIFFVSAPLSWLLVNSLLWIEPPENGFANYVHLFLGWLWLLPFCAFLALLEWIAFKTLELSKDTPGMQRVGRNGSYLLGLPMLAFMAYGFFGHISSGKALKCANYILQKQGYSLTAPTSPRWVDGHWLIQYPHSTFGEIRLDRNGRMSWIGGPG